MSKKLKLYKMIDKTDSNTTEKDIIDNVPFRMIICGRSGLGKTSLIGGLLLLPNFYKNDFLGERIFLFSPMKNDYKMSVIVKEKDVPADNIFTEYDDDVLNALYDSLVDEYEENLEDGVKDKKKLNSLIILDDMSFDGSLKSGMYNAINRVFMNGRKNMISICVSSQLYVQISTGQRSNATSIFFYNSAMRQRELFETDNNYLQSKKQFFKMLDDNLKNKRDFIYVNYSNEKDKFYLDKDFNVIDTSKYLN
tara:strand:- start:8462 stop:9214 length:753 start_codon:yes stop_codon:yes gene_type:complete